MSDIIPKNGDPLHTREIFKFVSVPLCSCDVNIVLVSGSAAELESKAFGIQKNMCS